LAEELRKEKPKDEMYAYFFVRQDISNEQQMVQAAHAAMVLGQNVSPALAEAWRTNFVIFGVPDLATLGERGHYLWTRGVDHYGFYEPDMGGELTAIACRPMRKSVAERKRLFANETLLKMGPNRLTGLELGDSPLKFPNKPLLLTEPLEFDDSEYVTGTTNIEIPRTFSQKMKYFFTGRL
jgi:hypothetical protein